jgi:hypothetical protein
MNPTDTLPAGVAGFVAAVRAELDDLAGSDRDELLDGLPADLTEAAAESASSLEETLGSPAAYADELRAAAGLPPRSPGAASPPLRARIGSLAPVRAASEQAATVLTWPWVRSVRAFLPELQPGWWVLRACVAAAWVSYAVSGLLVGLLAAAVFIPVSVQLGRAAQGGRRSGHLALANVCLAGAGLVLLLNTGPWSQPAVVYIDEHPDAALSGTFSGGISNLYPFSLEGEPLEHVLLYDQDGNPVGIDQLSSLSPEGFDIDRQLPTDAYGEPISNLFPLRQSTVSWDGARMREIPPRPVLPRIEEEPTMQPRAPATR